MNAMKRLLTIALLLACASVQAQQLASIDVDRLNHEALARVEVQAAKSAQHGDYRGYIYLAGLKAVAGGGGGGGGSGCVPSGSAGQLLTDDGAGACTSNTTGTGVLTALGVNVGSSGAPVLFNGALGTPSSGTGTNITGVNAATLGGATFAAPGAIGGGTPAAITGTAITGNSFVPNLSTIPTNGMYLPGANNPGIAANSTKVFDCTSTGCTVTGNLAGTGNISGYTNLATAGTLTTGKVCSYDGTNFNCATTQSAGGQVLASTSATAQAFTATPTLGASGTVGTLALGNATSGTVTIGTVAGALGSVTASLPANTGTIAELNLVQTWTAAQTFPSPVITGSAVTFTSGTSRTLANASEIVICTSTCTVTPPGTLTAGMQFCVQNDDNVNTVITLAAVANIQYEATARTSYGTANHTMTSGGAVKDQICMVAVSTTKYNVFSNTGTWTNN